MRQKKMRQLKAQFRLEKGRNPEPAQVRHGYTVERSEWRRIKKAYLAGKILLTLLLCFGCADSPMPTTASTPFPVAPPFVVGPALDPATACGAPVLSEGAVRDQKQSGMRCEEPNRVIGGEYSSAVIEAQHWVAANRRGVFWPNSPDVMDPTAYGREVAARLAFATGFCAIVEPDDIIHVKRGNGPTATSESFDILVSDGTPWNPPLMVQRCRQGSGW